MVQIIQENRQPSFSSQLGAQLGQGIGSGLTKGAEMAFKLRGEKHKQSQKELASIQNVLSKGLQLYDPDKLKRDPRFMASIADQMKNLVERDGYSAREAFDLVRENLLAEGEMEEEPGWKGEFSPQIGKDFRSKLGEEVKSGIAKGFRPLAQFGDIGRHTGEGLNRLAGSLMGMSPEEIESKQSKVNEFLNRGKSLTEQYDELTGGRGVPGNAMERILSGYTMGPYGIAANAVGEAAEGLGAPESVKNAAEFITFLGAHRLLPKKSPGMVIGDHVLKQAERIAADTGRSAEEVIASASEKSGVDLSRVLEGDLAEGEKLSEALSASKQRVKELPKTVFNPNRAQAERAEFGKKVKESPLEQYYEIEARNAEKEAQKTPATLAKEQEVITRLTPVEKQLSAEMRMAEKRIADLKRSKEKVFEPNGRARIDGLIAEQERKLAKLEVNLSDTRYEMRNFRPRPTEAQTAKQIEESVSRIKSEAYSPTPEGQAKIAKDMETDRKYLENAAKLDKRGALPGDLKPDTYVQMQKKYLEGYREAIKAEREAMLDFSKEQKMGSRRFIDHLENRMKALEAKITYQTDKQKAIRALEKPSGAFYKQQLKDTRRDLERFQKDFFDHVKHVKSKEAAKAHSAAQRHLNTIPKDSRSLLEKETNRFNEKAKESQMKKGMDELKKELPPRNVPASNPQVKKAIDRVVRYLKWGLPSSVIIGGIQAVMEEYSGVKPNATTIRQLGSIFTGVSHLGSAGISTQVHKFMRDWFEESEVSRLKSFKGDLSKIYSYKKMLLKKRGKSATKRIMDKYRSSSNNPVVVKGD